MAQLFLPINYRVHLMSILFVILTVIVAGSSACRQEAPIEFVPVGCRVINRVADGCPSKRIVCQGGRELRSACLQHKDPGSCSAQIAKYFYNPLSKRCEPFHYGGCLGNDNRFDTIDECEAACDAEKLPEVVPYDEFHENEVCQQSRQQGSNCNTQPPTTNWYYDAQAGRCRSFRFLGCGGNDNRFPSKADCKRRCVVNGGDVAERRRLQTCQLPAKRGTCFSSQTRWSYDKQAGECVTFVYSGCDGNENNFESKEECEQGCGEIPSCPYSRSHDYAVSDGCRLEWTKGSGRCETPMQVCDGNQQAVADQTDDDTHVCFKPALKGRCSGSQVRFYFDSEEQDCVQFEYSGCESNGNNFETKESCRAACRDVTDRNHRRESIRYIFADKDDSNDCALPAEIGWCFGRHERFFFDTFSGRCKSFQYSGCGGNGNNFASELQCERRCGDRSTSSIAQTNEPDVDENNPSTYCYQSPEQGPCNKWQVRYAFNATNGKCERFFYGGCEGNKNNFHREPDCRSSCSMYATSNGSSTDRQQLTKNRKVWICDQPANSGDCFGQHERWRYDAGSQTCVSFTYSGCGGNDNRFETFDKCIDACTGYRTALATSDHLGNIHSALLYDPDYSKEVAEGAAPAISRLRTSACLQKPKSGPCEAKHTRWYFDPATGSCATFRYGGCQANDNNFASRNECEQSCVNEDEAADVGYDNQQSPYSDLPSICTEPMQPGPCRGRDTKFWFNKVTRRCESFIYGGCGKNNNHFETEADCHEACGENRP